MQAIAGDFAKLESETALEEDRSSLFIQQCTELGNPMIVVGMILTFHIVSWQYEFTWFYDDIFYAAHRLAAAAV